MSVSHVKSDCTPKRETFHFHFPDGSSVWVEVEQDSHGEWQIADPEAAKMVADTLNSILSSHSKSNSPQLPLDSLRHVRHSCD
jgi:hypothetical protein